MTIESSNQPEAPKEIERKFKVKRLPDNLESFPKKTIKQGYVSIDDNGTEVRVREKSGKYYKTTKSGFGVVRQESESEISKEDFDKLWLETQDRTVEKTRYEIPLGSGNLAELDIYGGDLAGLMVVEVEFPDENAANNFVSPDWFGDDVSNDPCYKNSSLAVLGMPESFVSEVSSEKIPEYDLEEGVNVLVDKIKKKMEGQEVSVVVLVAGGSASGKTSAVADKVRETFKDDSIILSLDDYYRGAKFMKEMSAAGVDYNYDQPEAVDLDLFSKHLAVLKKGEPIEKPVYNFSVGEADGTKVVEPRRVIIIEGLFALNEKLVDLGDVKVFVEVGTHGRLIRRILRDIESRGQNPDDILDYFSKVVEPMHEEYVQKTKDEADMVISNEYNPETEARGTREVQLKFAGTIDSETLRKLGAERISHSTQVDTCYDPKDRKLSETGELLRIREESGRTVLSYKGPKGEGDFRVRSKIDFEIDPKTRDTFVKMYGDAVKVIKKERTLYQLEGVIFSLDSVTKIENDEEIPLGDFIEIRSVSLAGNDLEKVAKALGLNLMDGDKRSYSEM